MTQQIGTATRVRIGDHEVLTTLTRVSGGDAVTFGTVLDAVSRDPVGFVWCNHRHGGSWSTSTVNGWSGFVFATINDAVDYIAMRGLISREQETT